MSKFTCDFCCKNFSSASTLRMHIANAKYCIKLREGSKLKHARRVCNKCNKIFAEEDLTKHLTSCSKIKKSSKVENQSTGKAISKKCDEQKAVEESIDEKIVEIDKVKNEAVEGDHSNSSNEESVHTDIFTSKSSGNEENATCDISADLPKFEITDVDSTSSDSEWELGKVRFPTKETIEKFKSKYTFELFLKGDDGIVEFIGEMVEYQMEEDRKELERRINEKLSY